MHFSYSALDWAALGQALRLMPLRQALSDAIDRALPDGALDEEFTNPLLFVLSIRLNRLTRGDQDMTFSARCHTSTAQARRRPVRAIWMAMAAVIDLYCACFRGEVSHCATAWANHRARLARTGRA